MNVRLAFARIGVAGDFNTALRGRANVIPKLSFLTVKHGIKHMRSLFFVGRPFTEANNACVSRLIRGRRKQSHEYGLRDVGI